MITVIRTSTAFPGMTGEAVVWAKRIAAMVKRVTGRDQFVATAFAGMLSEIAWIAQYDSIAQYDDLRTRVLNDPEYIAALRQARDLFVPGSVRDQVWKHE